MADMVDTPWVDGLTIGQVLGRTAARVPGRDAIIFPQAGMRMSYAQFHDEVKKVARGLLAMGLTPGEHVGIWATNLPEWVLLQYAAASIGVVLVTINPAYRPFELSYTISQSDIVALFLTDQFKSSHYYQIFEEVCPQIAHAQEGMVSCEAFPKLRRVVALKAEAPPGYLTWQGMVAQGAGVDAGELSRIAATLSAEDVINIQYTSGTTGFPKAACLTHRNILMNAWYVTGCQHITEADRMCIPVPFYHCFGCVMGSLGAVTRGAAMVIPAEYFCPKATLSAIEAEHCTTIYGVPTMFVAMLDEPSFSGRNLTSLRSGIMAGSPCPIEVMRKVIDVMGCKDITIAYGQTETSPVVTQSRVGDPIELRVETVGQALPGVELKVVDAYGRAVADGEQGEICARGHGTMRGYYHNPEATEQAIDADGFVHTGDLGVRRADGYFKITGRLKDMVIRGGENIYPREIEEFLFTHPAIAQASVFGVPDDKYGEALCAWVQLHHGHSLTAETVRAFCKGSLAHYKVPSYIKFVESFPTTVSGKIQKFKMREQMCEELHLVAKETA